MLATSPPTPVILSEAFVRTTRAKAQSKDPFHSCAAMHTTRSSCRESLTRLESLQGEQAILRLRDCFASRTSPSAQDDNWNCNSAQDDNAKNAVNSRGSSSGNSCLRAFPLNPKSCPAPSTTMSFVLAGIILMACCNSSIDPNGSRVPCTNSAGVRRLGKC